jgi:hypothetical protein
MIIKNNLEKRPKAQKWGQDSVDSFIETDNPDNPVAEGIRKDGKDNI